MRLAMSRRLISRLTRPGASVTILRFDFGGALSVSMPHCLVYIVECGGFEVYAIIKTGGKQYRVAENDVISVDKLDLPAGDSITVKEVLLVSGDKGVSIGSPYVVGAQVECKIMRQYKGRKIHGFTYKPKKSSSRRYGHRQLLTALSIERISQAGDEPPKAKSAPRRAKKEENSDGA